MQKDSNPVIEKICPEPDKMSEERVFLAVSSKYVLRYMHVQGGSRGHVLGCKRCGKPSAVGVSLNQAML